MKREYDEFKVRINGLPEAIRRRSKSFNSKELKKAKSLAREKNGGVLPTEGVGDVPKATWMADGTQWPGTWLDQTADHKKGDHAGILQVITLLNDFSIYTHIYRSDVDEKGSSNCMKITPVLSLDLNGLCNSV
jgi:hypothetical protein